MVHVTNRRLMRRRMKFLLFACVSHGIYSSVAPVLTELKSDLLNEKPTIISEKSSAAIVSESEKNTPSSSSNALHASTAVESREVSISLSSQKLNPTGTVDGRKLFTEETEDRLVYPGEDPYSIKGDEERSADAARYGKVLSARERHYKILDKIDLEAREIRRKLVNDFAKEYNADDGTYDHVTNPYFYKKFRNLKREKDTLTSQKPTPKILDAKAAKKEKEASELLVFLDAKELEKELDKTLEVLKDEFRVHEFSIPNGHYSLSYETGYQNRRNSLHHRALKEVQYGMTLERLGESLKEDEKSEPKKKRPPNTYERVLKRFVQEEVLRHNAFVKDFERHRARMLGGVSGDANSVEDNDVFSILNHRTVHEDERRSGRNMIKPKKSSTVESTAITISKERTGKELVKPTAIEVEEAAKHMKEEPSDVKEFLKQYHETENYFVKTDPGIMDEFQSYVESVICDWENDPYRHHAKEIARRLSRFSTHKKERRRHRRLLAETTDAHDSEEDKKHDDHFLEDLALELEEKQVVRNVLKPFGNFEHIGIFGRNLLGSDTLEKYDASMEQDAERIRDIRRELRQKLFGGQKVIDVLQHLRKSKHERLGRRRKLLEYRSKRKLEESDFERELIPDQKTDNPVLRNDFYALESDISEKSEVNPTSRLVSDGNAKNTSPGRRLQQRISRCLRSELKGRNLVESGSDGEISKYEEESYTDLRDLVASLSNQNDEEEEWHHTSSLSAKGMFTPAASFFGTGIDSYEQYKTERAHAHEKEDKFRRLRATNATFAVADLANAPDLSSPVIDATKARAERQLEKEKQQRRMDKYWNRNMKDFKDVELGRRNMVKALFDGESDLNNLINELTALDEKRRLSTENTPQENGENASIENSEEKSTPLRLLQTATGVTYFETPPLATHGILDGHDGYCEENTESPIEGTRWAAGFPFSEDGVGNVQNPKWPRDATGTLYTNYKACGTGIVRYNIKTSNLAEYDVDRGANHVISFEFQWASFIPSETCEHVMDIKGGIGLMGCRFTAKTAKLFLTSRLSKNTEYVLHLRHRMPETLIRATITEDLVTPLLTAITPDPTAEAGYSQAETDRKEGFIRASHGIRLGDAYDPQAVFIQRYEKLRDNYAALKSDITKALPIRIQELVKPAFIWFSHEFLATENTFSVEVKVNNANTIEKSSQPERLGQILHNAKHPGGQHKTKAEMFGTGGWVFDADTPPLSPPWVYTVFPGWRKEGTNIPVEMGYVTGWTYRGEKNDDDRRRMVPLEPGVTVEKKMLFGAKFSYATYGGWKDRTKITLQPLPSDLWFLATLENDGSDKQFEALNRVGNTDATKGPGWYPKREQETTGPLLANNIKLTMGDVNANSEATNVNNPDLEFSEIRPPPQPVNMPWHAVSSYRTTEGAYRGPFSVEQDVGLGIFGTGQGIVSSVTSMAINTRNIVTLLLTAGNTIFPFSKTALAGFLVIIPPSGFQIDRTVAPGNVVGYHSLPCGEWPIADQQLGRWLCNIRDRAIFADTQYAVTLGVINPAQPEMATAWRMEVWQQDRSRPLAATRDVQGFPIAGTMFASLDSLSKVLNSVNKITFKFRPSRDIGIAANATFSITAPKGFVLVKRCPGFERGNLPANTVCKGTDAETCSLRFPSSNAIKGSTMYDFKLDITNPVQNLADDVPNLWVFSTVRPDGIISDTSTSPGFYLYPKQFKSFKIDATGYLAGVTMLIARFTSSEDIISTSFIRIRAPIGVDWDTSAEGMASFKTDAKSTGTYTMETYDLRYFSSVQNANYKNELWFNLRKNIYADYEYGLLHRVIIPAQTPVPNRYWLDSFIEFGEPGSGIMTYIASSGTPGFRTRALMNARVTPYNNVQLAWENPVTFEFETTTAVQSVLSDAGTIINQATFYVNAPPGFTFVCPTAGWNPDSMTIPDGFHPVPKNAECYINHQVAAERGKIRMNFKKEGLLKDTKYTFQVEIVNAEQVNPTTNVFHMASMIDEKIVEETRVPGYSLAQPMSNTRYIATQETAGHLRTVNAYNNKVVFEMTLLSSMPPNSVLQVKAPEGFVFPPDCLDPKTVGGYSNAPAVPLADQDIIECHSLAAASMEPNVIRMSLSGGLAAQTWSFFVTVENPSVTPILERNFWSIKLFEPGESVPKMAENYVNGFEIQTIREASIFPYNPANAYAGEAAPNPLDIRFKLTTPLNTEVDDKYIFVVPPLGFYFPGVCRNFLTNPNIPGYLGIPEGTKCNPQKIVNNVPGPFPNPELVDVYYRVNHPNFQAKYGISEGLISDDIKFLPRIDPPDPIDFPFGELRLYVRRFQANGVAEHSLVRQDYVLQRMSCDPEGGPTKILNCLDPPENAINPAPRSLVRSVIQKCGVPQGWWKVEPAGHVNTQKQLDTYIQAFADREMALLSIEECISAKVFRAEFDENKIALLMYLTGPTLVLQLPDKTRMEANTPYNFRVLVENPKEVFTDVTNRNRWWRIETRKEESLIKEPSMIKYESITGTQVFRTDYAYAIPSFAIYPRVSLFVLQTLNYVGQTETELKISFDITNDLAPQHDIVITAPEEFNFKQYPDLTMDWRPPIDQKTGQFITGPTVRRPCIPQMEAQEWAANNARFPPSAIKDVTRLPDYVKCEVVSNHVLRIYNSEPERGGMSLMAGPVYEFLVHEILNPAKTPQTASNLWRIVANTTTSAGIETWANAGYQIYPELVTTKITSSNPAVGLYTTFDLSFSVITEVPRGGAIVLHAPRMDYYFGDRLPFPGMEPDLLKSRPPPSGDSPPRPPEGTENECTVRAKPMIGNIKFICPITLVDCRKIQEMLKADPAAIIPPELNAACNTAQQRCDSQEFSKLFTCRYKTVLKQNFMTTLQLQQDKALVDDYNAVNAKQLTWEPYEGQLVITLASGLLATDAKYVALSPGQNLDLVITGYNTRYKPFTDWQNSWIFETRDADSGQTTLDEKKGVPGYQLYGRIYVGQIEAQETRVSSTYNRVTITFRLTNTVPQRGLVRITHPEVFTRVVGAGTSQAQGASQSNNIETSSSVPRKAKKTQRNNVIELDCEDEDFPSQIDMQIKITLSNPQISPARQNNIWLFETFHIPATAATGTVPPDSQLQRIDLNMDVQGFNIYGAFRSAKIASMLDSPTVPNLIAIAFVLESDLEFTSNSYLKLYLPAGFKASANGGCGPDGTWSRSYKKDSFINSASALDPAIEYSPIPPGSSCSDGIDDGLTFVLVKLEGLLQYGLDYAFTIEIINADYTPANNFFRFQTLLDNVLLHLNSNVIGFGLMELQDVIISASDTSRSKTSMITVQMKSTKRIPGGSDIRIIGPLGFKFQNLAPQSIDIPGGHTLASTTTSRSENNQMIIQLDPTDVISPNLAFSFMQPCINPEFTPADNNWRVEIVNTFGSFIDIKQVYPGYDITGQMQVAINPDFAFKGKPNTLSIQFVPSTILNQADYENVIVLKAPKNYRFPETCINFQLGYTNRNDLESSSMGEQAKSMRFPPEGIQCQGSGNETVRVTFPQGSGLLVFNYTLQMSVMNAAENPVNKLWSLETIKRAEFTDTSYTIVDAQRKIEGFPLEPLETVAQERSSGWRKYAHPFIDAGRIFGNLLGIETNTAGIGLFILLMLFLDVGGG